LPGFDAVLVVSSKESDLIQDCTQVAHAHGTR
jgi:hypothetical protein